MDLFSLKILTEYYNRGNLTLTQLGAILNRSPLELVEYVRRLMGKSLLRIESNYAEMHDSDPKGPLGVDIPLQLTIDGIEELEALQRRERERKEEKFRYRITTGIAAAALIISIVSIALQYL